MMMFRSTTSSSTFRRVVALNTNTNSLFNKQSILSLSSSSSSSAAISTSSTNSNSYTYAQLSRDVADKKIDTVVVGFTDLYGRLLGKRYDANAFIHHVGDKGVSHSCTYLLTADIELEPLDGFKLSSPSTGYGDFSLRPDYNTLRRITWLNKPGLDKQAMVFCDVLDEHGKEIPMAPRNILKRVLKRAEDENKISIKAASELEYYLFTESFRQVQEKGYRNMKRVGWYNEDYVLTQSTRTEPFHVRVRDAMTRTGLVVECTKGETGIGQHELNIEYDEALRMADNHIVYKTLMKEMADESGMAITFMAKPFHDSAGSSCHIHLSCHDLNTGKNLFTGNENLHGLSGVSPFFQHFLAGWMTYAPDFFALYAPTVNSYKRLVKGSWAPVQSLWDWDNRTTSFRVLGSGKSLRVEFRIPGADANPYLAFAAAAASGMAGVRNKMIPPPPAKGDAYQQKGLAPFPRSLGEAAENLEKSAMAKEAFGAETVEHLAHFYKLEQFAYDKQVGDWERNRYFERI
jgi:glutamine synthetase